MKKCFYIVLAAAAIVASCAKVELKEDQKIEPKAGATAQFSGTIIQPNGLGGGSKVYIAGQDETKVYVSWNKGDKVKIKREIDKWENPLPSDIKTFSAQNEGARTEFVCSEPIEDWASETSSYSAYYFGTKNAWWEYVFATSFDNARPGKLPSKFEFDCAAGKEEEIPVLLENMPLYSKTSTEKDCYYYFNFICYYGILQINVPAKLDFSDLYVCLSAHGGENQNVTFENGALKEGSEYALRLKNAARLKSISKYEGQEYVTYFVPVAHTTVADSPLVYSEIQVVAVKGSIDDNSAEEVARMKTYEYSNNSQDPVMLNVEANTIHFFDFCNTLTIKKTDTYNLVSNNNINYKVNIASDIDGEVTINAETDGFEPANIFINNHGHTVGKLVIEAKNSHVEGENGFATVVESRTSNSTFVVKPTLHITGLTVKKGSVVVEAEGGAANVEKITIPEGVTEQITIDVTGVSGSDKSEKVEIVNKSGKEKVLVVANASDKEYYVTEGQVTEVTKETVATIGDAQYATLADAIAAVKDDETIVMVADVAAAEGISVESGKNFTVDFGGHTYSTECPGAGSAGTKTAAFQLLKNSTIVFKNGTINCTEANKDKTWVKTDTSKGIAIIIQNYANLTLEDMTIDGANIAHNGTTPRYVVSNNSGNVEFKGNTTISAPVTGDYAFDACKDNSYDAPVVTWNSTGSVKGMIDLTGGKFVVAKDLAVTEPVVAGEASAQSTLEVNAKLSAASAFSDPNTQISNKKSTAPLQVKRGADLSVCGNGTIEGAETYAAIVVAVAGDNESKTAKLTFDGVTAQGQYFGIAGNGNRHNTEIVINGGVIKGLHDKDNLGIFNPQAGSLTINGGEISGYSSAIEMRAGELTINGGDFTAEALEYKYAPSGSGNTTTGAAIAVAEHNTKKGVTVVLNEGTFTAVRPLAVEDVNEDFDTNINITKAQDLDIAAPEGYEWSNNKLVKASAKTAKIGGVEYDTLEEAFAAVPVDGTATTVTLLQNIGNKANDVITWTEYDRKFAYTVSDKQNITFDLNGKKIYAKTTVNGYTGFLLVKNGGSLTIKDSAEGGEINYLDGKDNEGGLAISSEGNLVIESGTIENHTVCHDSSIQGAIDVHANEWGNHYAYHVTFTMNGGVLKSQTDNTLRIYDSSQTGTGSVVIDSEINGGEVYGADAVFIMTQWTKTHCSNETYMNNINVSVKGGKFITNNGIRVVGNVGETNNKDYSAIKINVSGGDFTILSNAKYRENNVAFQNSADWSSSEETTKNLRSYTTVSWTASDPTYPESK